MEDEGGEYDNESDKKFTEITDFVALAEFLGQIQAVNPAEHTAFFVV